MINRWFCIDDVTYNLSAFTHFRSVEISVDSTDKNNHVIHGYLNFPVPVEDSPHLSRSAHIQIGSTRYTKDKCLSILPASLMVNMTFLLRCPV